LTKISFGVLTALLLLPLHALAQQFDGQNIGEVRLTGLERISDQAVRAQIEVQPGQAYNDRAIARDIRRLYGLGYFSQIQAEAAAGPNGVILTYVVAEKQFVQEIRIAGNGKQSTRRITGALTMREGDPFFPESLAGEREAIIALYESKGYANTTVDIASEVVGPSRVRLLYTINEGRKARIRSIKFVGNESLESKELRKAMKTKRAWWFLGGKYEEDKLEFDLDELLGLYGEHGRLEAEVQSVDIVYSDDGKRMDITIAFKEGPEYTVGDMQYADNVVYGPDELVEIAVVGEGDVHNKKQVTEDAQQIEQLYQDSGFVNAQVEPQVTLDTENHTTNVVHRVAEGDVRYIRQIDIVGNEVTKDEVIRRQVLLSPSDRFDGAAQEYSQRALEQLDYFDKVRLTLSDVPDSDLYSDMLIDVEEGRTGNFLFGGGFSTDEGIGGYSEIKLRNFDISNWKTFSGGGQQLRLRANIGSQRTSYLLSFTDPEFMSYPFSFGFDVYDQSNEIEGGQEYTEDQRGVSLRLGKALSNTLYWSWSIAADSSKVSDVPYFNFLRDPRIPDQRERETTIRTSNQLRYSTFDRRFDTTEGTQQTLGWEVAGLGGDYEFIKLQMDSEWFIPLDEDRKWVLSLRTREGYVTGYGDTDLLPLQERMYAGGTSTVRGFENRDIGPRTRKRHLTDDFALGGELRWVTNTEIKYRASELVRVYGFVDTGGVWYDASDFDLGDVKASVGLGLGFNIPKMGPIRVDYGYPINPDGEQGSGRLHINGGFAF